MKWKLGLYGTNIPPITHGNQIEKRMESEMQITAWGLRLKNSAAVTGEPTIDSSSYGWLSKFWSLFGYPKY